MQHQPADMAVAAILGIFEAETALQAQPAIRATTQAQTAGMYGLVEPLHTSGQAGIAPDLLGAFGRGTRRAPEGEPQTCADHHDQ